MDRTIASGPRTALLDRKGFEEVEAGVGTLLWLREQHDRAQNAMNGLAGAGQFMRHFYQLHDFADGLRAMAYVAFAHATVYPNLSSSGGAQFAAEGRQLMRSLWSNPSNVPQMVEGMAELAVAHRGLPTLFAIHEHAAQERPFVEAVISRIADRPDATTVLAPPDILSHCDVLSEALEDDRRGALLRSSAADAGLCEAAIDHGFQHHLVGFYVDLLNALGDEEPSEFHAFLVDGLQAIREEQWREDLESGDERYSAVDLVLTLLDSGHELALGQELADALHHQLRQLLEDSDAPRPAELVRDHMSKILSALAPEWRRDLLKRVLDLAVEHGDQLQSVLELYGEALLASEVLSEDADTVVRRLFAGIVERREKAELGWLAEAIERDPTVLKKCRDDTLKTFKDRARSALAEDTENQDVLRRIARVLRIQVRQKPAAEGADTG